MHKKKYNTEIIYLLNKTIKLAGIDGGLIIAVRIFAFLCAYININNNFTFLHFHITKLAVIIINIINSSIIIIRILGINNGNKYSLNSCINQAMRHLFSMIFLYIISTLILLIIFLPIAYFSALLSVSMITLLMILMFAFLPFMVIAGSFVIDQNLSAIQSIISTFNLVKENLDYKIMLFLIIIYVMPMVIFSMLSITGITVFNRYIILLMQIWILFCDIISVTIYTETQHTIKCR